MGKSSLLGCNPYPVIGVSGGFPKLSINLTRAALDIRGVMPASKGKSKAPQSQSKTQLHVCPECSSALVQPVAWEQVASSTEWRLWRRCPECEWNGDDVHREASIDEYDEQLDFGTRELAEELRALERANMEEAVDSFIGALQADLILPEDF
jgi:hypothetical protein